MRRAASVAYLAVLGLVCGACAKPSNQSVPAADDSVVRLAFGWKPGLGAEVFARTRKVRADGRANPERSIETRHRIRTEPHERGLRVVSEDFEILRVDGQEASIAAPASDPTTLFLAPTLVIGAAGEVVEVEGLDALRRWAAEQIAAAGSAAAAHAGQAADLATSQERLTDHWTSAVGSWVGLELEPGAAYDVELDAGGEAQPGRIEVSEFVPCSEEDVEPRCLRIRMESRSKGSTSREETQERVRALASQLGVADLPVDIIRAADESELVELVTEPASLIPHLVHVRRERHIEIEADGATRRLDSVDETEHLYRW